MYVLFFAYNVQHGDQSRDKIQVDKDQLFQKSMRILTQQLV